MGGGESECTNSKCQSQVLGMRAAQCQLCECRSHKGVQYCRNKSQVRVLGATRVAKGAWQGGACGEKHLLKQALYLLPAFILG